MKPGIILKLFHSLYFVINRESCQILPQRQRWHKYYEVKDKLSTVLQSEDFQPF